MNLARQNASLPAIHFAIGVGGLSNDGTTENKMTSDLEEIWQRLLAMSRRQQSMFAYHIAEDGMPVWDATDVADEYTGESYAQEQMP